MFFSDFKSFIFKFFAFLFAEFEQYPIIFQFIIFPIKIS